MDVCLQQMLFLIRDKPFLHYACGAHDGAVLYDRALPLLTDGAGRVCDLDGQEIVEARAEDLRQSTENFEGRADLVVLDFRDQAFRAVDTLRHVLDSKSVGATQVAQPLAYLQSIILLAQIFSLSWPVATIASFLWCLCPKQLQLYRRGLRLHDHRG